jgi:hypothetical protein
MKIKQPRFICGNGLFASNEAGGHSGFQQTNNQERITT